MANPVSPSEPSIAAWQDDAPTADTNTPQDAALMDPTGPTSFPGELRNMKSVTREMSLDLGWITYDGLISAPDGGAGTITIINAAPPRPQFALQGDWSSIATIGRQVRLSSSGGPLVAGTILAVSVAVGVTTVTILCASAILNGQIWFGVQDPTVPEDVFTPVLAPDPAVGGASLPVLAVRQGGTGNALANVPVGGDLVGLSQSAVVARLQSVAVSSFPPNDQQVLAFIVGSPSRWTPTDLSTLLAFAATLANPGALNITTLTPPGTFVLQWVSQSIVVNLDANGNATVVLTLAQAFPTGLLAGVAQTTQNPPLGFTAAALLHVNVASASGTNLTINVRAAGATAAASQSLTVTISALCVGH